MHSRTGRPRAAGDPTTPRTAALAALGALVFLLSYPPAPVPPAILGIAVPFLLIASGPLQGLLRRAAWICGTLAGAGLVQFWWLGASLTDVVGVAPPIGHLVVAAYVLMLAAVHTAAMVLPQRLRPALRLPATFVTLAAAVIAIPWPLPVSPAHSALDLPALPGLAAIGGVAAVDLAILATNLLLAALLLARGRARLRPALGLAAVLAAVLLLPPLGRALAPPAPAEDTTLRIAVLQPAIPLFRRLLDTPGLRDTMLERTFAMMEAAATAEPRPALIVLPEYPLLTPIFADGALRARFDRFAADHGIPLLLSTFRPLAARRQTNSAILVTGGDAYGHTDKQVLFPFGEYLPGETALPALRRVFPFAGGLVPGAPPTPLFLAEPGIALAVLMCFDDTMTAVTRRVFGALRPAVPTVAISMSNTQSFGDSRARDLHLLLARYRAIESGLPILRVANDGHTGLILPDGRPSPTLRLPEGLPAWSVLEIPVRPAPLLHAAAIDAMLRQAIGAAAALVLLGLFATRRRARLAAA